jgi:hypothetical protein
MSETLNRLRSIDDEIRQIDLLIAAVKGEELTELQKRRVELDANRVDAIHQLSQEIEREHFHPGAAAAAHCL